MALRDGIQHRRLIPYRHRAGPACVGTARELYGSHSYLKGTMMRTNGRNWTGYEISAYRQARREGKPVSLAFARVLSERVAHRILPPRDVWDHGGASGWRVDASELAAATTDPSTDALFGVCVDGTTGERILSRVILPTDARATITVRDDVDGDPHEFECYATEDIIAWAADEWRYVTVEAHVSLPDGRSDTATMGGVETGEYWGTSLEASILHTVADLISEALAGAEAIPVAGPPTVASMPGDVASWPL